jgi:hypothetical protein
MRKLLKTDIFLYASLLAACIFVLLQSPFAPFAKSINGVDSSVFVYAAQQMLDGQLIYKDIVDHKGLFLYFINAAALFIFNGHYIGIWIFEVFSLLVASIMMYKTARLFADKISALFAVLTAVLFLEPLLIGGNFTEEWSLPYICIALYIFADYLKGDKPFTIVRLLILSVTFVLTFMLRANLIAVWAGFGVVLLIKWIVERKYMELTRNLSLILLFVVLSLLPFFIYLCYNGILPDFIYLSFKFNMFEYAPKPISVVIKKSFKTLTGISFISIVPVITLIYMFLRKRTFLNAAILSALCFTSLLCSLGGVLQHYFIVFAPLLVIPYAFIFTKIKDGFHNAKYICLFLIFIFYNYTPINNQRKTISLNYSEKGYGLATIPPLTMEKLKNVIVENSNPTDKILVNGNQCSVYLYSNRKCAIRFPFPLSASSLSKKYYVKDVENALPKLIIQGEVVNYLDSFNLDTLLSNKYQLIETDIEGVEIWKVKE